MQEDRPAAGQRNIDPETRGGDRIGAIVVHPQALVEVVVAQGERRAVLLVGETGSQQDERLDAAAARARQPVRGGEQIGEGRVTLLELGARRPGERFDRLLAIDRPLAVVDLEAQLPVRTEAPQELSAQTQVVNVLPVVEVAFPGWR